MESSKETVQQVKDYYGEELTTSADLKTTACCTGDAIPVEHKKILATLEDEILAKFYGCGSPLPESIKGRTVLDLGCGSGRDVYLASKLVGETGYVIGVDMTDNQLEVAQRNIDKQMRTFGFSKPNVSFRKGYIEDLQSVEIADNSVDIVISNCVLNLSVDKKKAFAEIFRVLKPGGELYFSDVFADRRVPADLIDDPVLYGECLSGALYTEDFRRIMLECGFQDFRVVEQSPIGIENPDIEEKLGMINFDSITIRAFKLANLEDTCEDYGQIAIYKGTIDGMPHSFDLDDHHQFITGKPYTVCGNTASMLGETRFAEHFTILGDRAVHYGLFDCSETPAVKNGASTAGCC